MAANNMTVKEHFVPRTYLKGFSFDGENIYEYRLKDGFQPSSAVKIESICYKKYLYEIRDKNDEIVFPNYVENQFCNIEGTFSTYKKQIERKAFIRSNFQSTQFLTVEEKDFWKYYIAIQILRSPQVLELAEAVTKKEFPISMENNQARLFALACCLSSPTNSNTIPTSVLVMYLEAFKKMSIVVGVDNTDTVFTSDFPVYAYSPTQSYETAEEIIFPLTSELVIYLFGGHLKSKYRKNCLFAINTDELKRIKRSIAYTATTWIYSKKPLSIEEKRIINEAHKDKMQDMNNKGE